MSAEKCSLATPVMAFPEKIDTTLISPEHALSPKGIRMLNRIRCKYPKFSPFTEADVWMKAYKMGLTEEE